MNQPDLGFKVVELRKQKGLTQEQLANQCEVTARTIQRIESGEVDPRVYTLSMLSKALEFNLEEDNSENENLWLVILHLSTVFCIPVIPLLLWSWKKPQSIKIDNQGQQVLNFQITMVLMIFAALFFIMFVPAIFRMLGTSEATIPLRLLVICVPMPLVLTGLFCIFQGIVNAMRAVADRPIHYPLSIPFVK